LLGYLMYRSRFVPRRMALLGLIGGPLAFASSNAILFGAYEQTGDALHPVNPGNRLGGVARHLLIVKGFKPSPILNDTHRSGGRRVRARRPRAPLLRRFAASAKLRGGFGSSAWATDATATSASIRAGLARRCRWKRPSISPTHA
jgi:hypothetical protein